MPAGRPTKYTKELGDKICDDIATSNRGLAFICAKHNINPSTVFEWIRVNEEFSHSYARAREAQADFLADEILEIADHSDKDTVTIYDRSGNPVEVEDKEWTNRSRLRVDARKWIAAKLRPKKYGDKVDVTTDGEKINKVQIEVIKADAPLAGSEKDVKLD